MMETLPGLDGELIDVTTYRPHDPERDLLGRRRPAPAPPALPRQWYPLDVMFAVTLSVLLVLLVWLVLR